MLCRQKISWLSKTYFFLATVCLFSHQIEKVILVLLYSTILFIQLLWIIFVYVLPKVITKGNSNE